MGEGIAVLWLRRRDDYRGGGVVVVCGGDVLMIGWNDLTDEGRTAVLIVALIVEAWLLWG